MIVLGGNNDYFKFDPKLEIIRLKEYSLATHLVFDLALEIFSNSVNDFSSYSMPRVKEGFDEDLIWICHSTPSRRQPDQIDHDIAHIEIKGHGNEISTKQDLPITYSTNVLDFVKLP